jgi:CheY-like chemotaxis protein
MRVLIVDDNRDQADSLRFLLHVWGHDARAAYSGREGLIAVRHFEPEVVLLDLQMPLMSGGELARHLRQWQGTRSLRLIAVSGNEQDDAEFANYQSLFDGHFRKTGDLATLKKLLG